VGTDGDRLRVAAEQRHDLRSKKNQCTKNAPSDQHHCASDDANGPSGALGLGRAQILPHHRRCDASQPHDGDQRKVGGALGDDPRGQRRRAIRRDEAGEIRRRQVRRAALQDAGQRDT